MENGEYVRSVESGEEENHSFIDGNKNNGKKKHGRESVLKKLRQKQAEIAKRHGKPAQQMEMPEQMERRRKYAPEGTEAFPEVNVISCRTVSFVGFGGLR